MDMKSRPLWSDENNEDYALGSKSSDYLRGVALNLYQDIKCLKEDLHEALAKLAAMEGQAPCAWMNEHCETTIYDKQVDYWRSCGYKISPLYAKPVAATRPTRCDQLCKADEYGVYISQLNAQLKEYQKATELSGKVNSKLMQELMDKPAVAVPVELNCTQCGAAHIDEGEWAARLHKTHQCQHCGHEWRPFEYPTVGVAPSHSQQSAPISEEILKKAYWDFDARVSGLPPYSVPYGNPEHAFVVSVIAALSDRSPSHESDKGGLV